MINSKSKVNKNTGKGYNCSEPGHVNMHVKIDGDKRDRDWDFLHGCWKEHKAVKEGWDFRFS